MRFFAVFSAFEKSMGSRGATQNRPSPLPGVRGEAYAEQHQLSSLRERRREKGGTGRSIAISFPPPGESGGRGAKPIQSNSIYFLCANSAKKKGAAGRSPAISSPSPPGRGSGGGGIGRSLCRATPVIFFARTAQRKGGTGRIPATSFPLRGNQVGAGRSPCRATVVIIFARTAQRKRGQRGAAPPFLPPPLGEGVRGWGHGAKPPLMNKR
jgi:hypothetical protein